MLIEKREHVGVLRQLCVNKCRLCAPYRYTVTAGVHDQIGIDDDIFDSFDENTAASRPNNCVTNYFICRFRFFICH